MPDFFEKRYESKKLKIVASLIVFLFFVTKNLISMVKAHTGQQIMNEYNLTFHTFSKIGTDFKKNILKQNGIDEFLLTGFV